MLQVQKSFIDQRRMRSPSVISTVSCESVSSTQVQPSSIYSHDTQDDISDMEDATQASSAPTTGDHHRPWTPDVLQDDDFDLPFFALALFDFESDDPDHMPFQKNEIIQIIATEDSGWWAAQRGELIGWVPGAFVAFIPPRLVRRLQILPPEVREHDYNAEVVHAMESLNLVPELEQAMTMVGGDRDSFVPGSTDLLSPLGFPTDVTPSAARFNIHHDFPLTPVPPQTPYAKFPPTPRKPTAPQGPAPAPQPSQRSILPFRTLPATPLPRSANNPPALKVSIAPLSINKNKPTPPTPRASTPPPASLPSPSPVLSISSISKASVASFSSSSSSFLPRSRSAGSPAITSISPASMRYRHRGYDPSSSSSSFSPSSQRQRGQRLFDPNDTYVTSPHRNSDVEEEDIEDEMAHKFVRNASVSGGSIDKIKRLTGDDKAQAFANAKRAEALLPWFLKPVHGGDEIKLEHDGSVRAGTLEALVERLTMPALRAEHEARFRNTFLKTFHAFTTAEEVFELLVERYQMDAPPNLGEDHFEEWKNKNAMPTRSRVLFTFKLWVESHGLVQDDPLIVPRLRDFLRLVISPLPHAQTAQSILKELEQRHEPSPPLRSAPLPNTASPPPRKSSKRGRNELLRLDHGDLARQLTLYEVRLYMKIRPHECMTWANAPRGEGVKNLKTFVATNDKLAAWVKMSVLGNDALGRRADTIDMWIKVAEKCRALNNFSSMSAIIAALTSQVIGRLQLTWAHVHRASHMDPLVKLVQPVDNFGALRSALAPIDGPCLPYIGIYLSDMVRVSEPMDSVVTVPLTDMELIHTLGGVRELKLINFIKYQRMADIMQNILKHQPRIGNYGVSEMPSTMQFLESQLSLAASKDEGGFWMRSQEVQHAELAHADIRKGLEAAGF